jgi:hypothetical protein
VLISNENQQPKSIYQIHFKSYCVGIKLGMRQILKKFALFCKIHRISNLNLTPYTENCNGRVFKWHCRSTTGTFVLFISKQQTGGCSQASSFIRSHSVAETMNSFAIMMIQRTAYLKHLFCPTAHQLQVTQIHEHAISKYPIHKITFIDVHIYSFTPVCKGTHHQQFP